MSKSCTQQRFRFENRLGSGAVGTVYRVHDAARGASVALKVLERADPTALLYFKNEFRALANLTHPNLVQLYELVQVQDEYMLSMELVDGCDFLSFVRSAGSAITEAQTDDRTEVLPAAGYRHDPAPAKQNDLTRRLAAIDERKLRHALRQMAEGLRALHASGHLHRDLKPANVLVFRESERLVICDFGLVTSSSLIARRGRPQAPSPATGDARGSSTPSTSGGAVAGTLAFMAPEQASGWELTDAADWYSVGCMLYQALTLRVPFDPSLPWDDAVHAKLHTRPPHPCDVAPGAPRDLADLAMALLSPDPDQRAGYAEVVETLGGDLERDSVPSELPELLVGRERELEALEGAYAAAGQGGSSVALVSGFSGMGKSAVVQCFLERAEQGGARVLRGRCYECENLPYKAIDPLMDALSTVLLELPDEAVAGMLPPDMACLAEIFPVVRRVPAVRAQSGSPQTADPFERKRRAGAACRRLLGNLSKRTPLVLYVDDLQWGDPESAFFIGELLRPDRDVHLLVLFAYRAEDELGSPLLRALEEKLFSQLTRERTHRVRVEALDERDSLQLAQALLAGAPNAERVARKITGESGGSPFFIRELCSYARAHGADSPETWKLETVIQARIQALPEHSRTLLEFVAAAGRPETQALLNQASGLGDRAFAAGQTLRAHNLVHSSGTLDDARLEAYHDRIREAAYAALDEQRRSYIHRMLAATLEDLADRGAVERDAEALWEHWRRAGEEKRAADYAVQAADKAVASLAFLHAAKLYQSAIELMDEGDLRICALEGKAGEALMLAGRPSGAADALFRAMRGAPEQQAQDYWRLAITQLLSAREIEVAAAELARAKDVFGVGWPKSTLQAVAMMIGRRLGVKVNEKVLAGLDAVTPREPNQRITNLFKVSTSVSAVDFLRGGVYTAEHTRQALAHGAPYHVALALGAEAIRAASTNDDAARIQWLIDRGLQQAERSGDLYVQAATLGMVGVSRYLEGRFEDALQLVRESQRIHRQRLNATAAWDLVAMNAFEMRTLSQIGCIREITERVPEAVQDAEARGDLFASTMFRVGRMSWAWLGLDRPDEARAQLETAQRQWIQPPYQLTHYYMLQAAAELSLYENTPETVWDRVLRERKRMKLLNKIQMTKVEQLYLTGRLALQLADKRNGDPRYLREARKSAQGLQGISSPWSQLLGRLLMACLALRSSREAALSLFHPLPEQFDAVGMRLSAAVARYHIGQLMGEERGRGLVDSARTTIEELGAKNPERFVDMTAPGLGTA